MIRLSDSSRFVLKSLRKQWPLRALLLLFGVSSALISVGIPGVVGLSLAAMSGDVFPKLGISPDLYTAVLGLTILLFARLLFTMVAQMLTVRLKETSNIELQTAFHKHIVSLTQSDYQRLGEERLINSIFFELGHVATLFQSGLNRLVGALVVMFGSLAVMAVLAPELTLIVAFVAPLTFFTMRFANHRLRKLSKKYWVLFAELRNQIMADIHHLYLLKAFDQTQHRRDAHRAQLEVLMDVEIKRSVLVKGLASVNQIIGFLGVASVALLAHQGTFGEPLQMTGLLTFVLYGTTLTNPLRDFASLYQDWQEASGAVQRVDEVLQAATERTGGDTMEVQGSIELKNVSFAYRPGEPILSDLSVKITAGETIALVGTNGAGKTTLLALLGGFWEPLGGDILFDGVSTKTLSLESMRRAITVVPQHTEMLNHTIFENIRFGMPHATEEAVKNAAFLAHADEFIEKLEAGYQTRVGYQGIQLSGGQRQRIALARAVLYDAPIVVLDEATSMFDPDSEVEVLRRLEDWLAQRTVIIVTHRPAPLELVDRVLRLEDGQITG